MAAPEGSPRCLGDGAGVGTTLWPLGSCPTYKADSLSRYHLPLFSMEPRGKTLMLPGPDPSLTVLILLALRQTVAQISFPAGCFPLDLGSGLRKWEPSTPLENGLTSAPTSRSKE